MLQEFYKARSKPCFEFIFNFVTPNRHLLVSPLWDLAFALSAAFTKMLSAGLETMN
jgi:hypothetical protein